MRLWSLHPEYLDAKGLVALWREGLLAYNVLLGKTKGYKNHPQLIRFKRSDTPVRLISAYLHAVVDEADRRGYKFNREKLDSIRGSDLIFVTRGQIEYEFKHLLAKLKLRDPKRYDELKSLQTIKPHPFFKVIEGKVEAWEVIH